MAALTEPQKLFIIQRLAMYDSPTQISEAVKEEFGIDVDRRQIWQYDPERAGAGRISKKLVATFEATRTKFLEDVGSIPIAQRSFRLRQLQRLLDGHMKRKNYVAAAQVLEQAAKESGDVFTNVMKHKGKIDHAHDHEHSFAADEKRASLSDLIEQALAATAPKTPAPKSPQTKH